MKKICIALAALTPLLLPAASVSRMQLAGSKSEAKQVVLESGRRAAGAKVTVDELFACPENTVLDGPFLSEEVGFQGFQSSDQGRPGMATKFYQAFHGCTKTVNAVRVIGLFNYYDDVEYNWYGCDGRGGMQEDFSLTAPVKFEIEFYRQDADGGVGELVQRQETDIVGRYLGVTYGMGDNASPLYEFRADLETPVSLECGFMAFSAVDMGDQPTCWFSIFTADTSMDYAYVDMGSYGRMFANLPAVFSFMGDGSAVASKALRIDKMTAPVANSNGTHEKVSVKIVNVGSDAVSDTKLALFVDGEEVATEDIATTLLPGASFTYTFKTRVDLSEAGSHQVEVMNITEGDADISRKMAAVTTYTNAPGEFCESGCEYEDIDCAITRVVVGTIDNSSEESSYTDYTADPSCCTEIRPGQTLTLSIEPLEVAIAGVWVDWNGDGVFNGLGEEIGYIYDKPLEISLPDGINLTEGTKRMRIVLDGFNEPAPCGSYYFGETEDYGLIVKRSDNTPSVESDIVEVAEEAGETPSEVNLSLSNSGDATLSASIGVTYVLPDVYETRQMAPAAEFGATVKAKAADAPVAAAADNTAADANIAHVLRYDGGYASAVSLGNFDAGIFASYYPREQMAALKGMKLASVEVYINELPEGTSIKVFGQGDSRSHSGELLAEKVFDAQPGCWNVVELDTPVEITGEDLWFGISMTGMSSDKYHIAIDAIPAVAGYGDVCNVGGQTWWSMSELGIDHNFCVRGNIVGEPTPYLSWVKLDKNTLTLENGESAAVKATLDPTNLDEGTYEAAIKITSNDELKPSYSIPVYFVNGTMASLDVVSVVKSEIKVTAEGISVTAADALSNIHITDISGKTVMNEAVGSSTSLIPLDNLASGVYVMSIRYIDGTVESMKFAISR